MRFHHVAARPLFAALASMGACTNHVDGDRPVTTTEIADQRASAVTFAVPADVESERVYLGSTNWVHVSEELPWQYGVFDLNPKARVLIELYEPTAWGAVGFKVLRVEANGALTHLGTIDGADGYAAALLSTRSGGSYVVESVANGVNATLALDITCARPQGGCSPDLQPGDFCGSRGTGPCEEGLYCQIAEGCGRADEGGTCERPAEICPAVFGPAVCGCDGKTYGTACGAASVGVNVDYEGECPCSGDDWQTKVDGAVEVMGSWVWKGPYSDFDVSARLDLNDGDFGYRQTWDPMCLHTPPYCRRASLVFSMAGTWQNLGSSVQLYPEGEPAPQELAQSFGVEQNCWGDVRLRTTELGEDRVFERDRCADLQCAEGEHCELQEVQCIRAPCYPVPTCVSDG